ncbi:sarcoglycan alpha/epsilon domain-containing protein [Phthorimaea operculella]|nr:sarcoglycan alpha/epsilon domain-containing protein [Phthorimaea operculella]
MSRAAATRAIEYTDYLASKRVRRPHTLSPIRPDTIIVFTFVVSPLKTTNLIKLLDSACPFPFDICEVKNDIYFFLHSHLRAICKEFYEPVTYISMASMGTKILLISLIGVVTANHVHNAVETEMFAIPISPNMFNWTYQEFDHQYRFHASLVGKPELPSWLRYIYSRRHHSGFIFGTPPRGTKSEITLEVIGVNHADYETRRNLVTLHVHPKEAMARHEVELKVDNLNVEDLLDQHKMTRLKDILRTKLWPESNDDLYATFLASAIDLGARLPLKPSDGEGLVVRFGSMAPFSSELKRLREEVRPLSRLPSCPRGLKKTTVEKIFREAELMLDWCRFELYNTIYKDRSTEHLEYLTEIPNTSKGAKSAKALDPKDVDPVSETFIENIFHICSDYKKMRAHKSGNVEVCRYGTGNTEQSNVQDNASNTSIGAR